MDLKRQLLLTPNPEWTGHLCEYVSADKKRFQELMNFFLSIHHPDYRLNQRATLILLAVEKKKPLWIKQQIGRMCSNLRPNLPVAYKRNLLRVLQNQPIPEKHWGTVADQCFKYLSSPKESIAVKVFSMTVLFNLTKHVPELGGELKFLIEEQYPFGSAGFKARGRKVLSALRQAGH